MIHERSVKGLYYNIKIKEINVPNAKVRTLSNKVWIVQLQWYDKYEEEVEIQDIGDNFLFCTT